MNPILTAVLVVGIIGVIGAALLVAASKIFAVTENETAKAIQLVLPNGNCGGCGFAGCADYARAIAEGAPGNLCTAGGPSVAEKIAAITGKDAGKAKQYRAMVSCQGDDNHTKKRFEYHGVPTCAACNVLFSGDSSCPFGCIGFGDCQRACKYDAITIKNGLARIDVNKCVGCGACKAACPKDIILLYEVTDKPKRVIMCSNVKKAPATRQDCTAGCIGCGKCMRNCPVQAIRIEKNLARVNLNICINCGKCAENCPTGAIGLAAMPLKHPN